MRLFARFASAIFRMNLEPGQSAKFIVQTVWVADPKVFSLHEVRWTEQ